MRSGFALRMADMGVAARVGRRLAVVLVMAVGACGESPTGTEAPPVQQPAAVASVEVAPGTVQLEVGSFRRLEATVRDGGGRVLAGRTVAWSSGDVSVATVDASGNLVAHAPGRVRVAATSGGRTGEALVEVGAEPVASVEVAPGSFTLDAGSERKVGVTLRGADGTVLVGRPVAWSSSDPAVAAVDADGTVRALRGGTATVTAASGGAAAQVKVSVPLFRELRMRSVNDMALPAQLRTSVIVDEHGVARRRWETVAGATLRFSTTSSTWEQELTVIVSDEIVFVIDGVPVSQGSIATVKTVRDRGEVLYDVFNGEVILESAVTKGVAHRGRWTGENGFTLTQPLPGIGGAYVMAFGK